MSEIDAILEAAAERRARGERMALATVVSVRGSSYRRPGARLLVPEEGSPIGLISGGCLEEEAARLAREALDLDAPMLVTIDHSAEGDELWGMGLGCRGVIELLAEPPEMAAETLDALTAARVEGRPTYLLTGLDGERRRLTATEADALGERAAWRLPMGGRRSSARPSSTRSFRRSISSSAAPAPTPVPWSPARCARGGASTSSIRVARGCARIGSPGLGSSTSSRPRRRMRRAPGSGPPPSS